MHLKSLTMKGFKSFASSTTLRFEPGITAVVGPNGSGKSNVVDAIAWVLGEQGAKALRGGKMQDVIFAGTAGRAPLGRAEVTLTIDNSDAALPIDYTEVSITRRMFRDGASEYEINGDSVRLLDIQELLSDSGIGREMHVIVGQGQLDNVLQARPEDRRGFIEEAAGVLKHRKRKEKALRKLDGLQANLARLNDLTNELRRQLKPLGRQADLARRAAGVQAELRDCKLRLLAHDLMLLRTQLDDEVADETVIRLRRSVVEQELAAATHSESLLEAELAQSAPALAQASEVHFALAGLQERFRGTQQLSAERIRHLSEVIDERSSGREPEDLEADAAKVREQETALHAEVEVSTEFLDAAVAEREGAEAALERSERELLAAARAVADRREGLATLTGHVNALRARATAAADEISRIAVAAGQARERATAAAVELDAAEGEVGGLDDDAQGLETRHEAAELKAETLTIRLAELDESLRHHEREISTWTARRDALALGLAGKDGAAELLRAGQVAGVLGALSGLITVSAGYGPAIAAALAAAADAVVVESPAAVQAALAHLKLADGGRAAIVVANLKPIANSDHVPAEPSARRSVQLPERWHWASDLISAPDTIRASLSTLLEGVVVVEDLAAAQQLLADHPALKASTVAGDFVSAAWAVGGSASAPSTLELQSEIDAADAQVQQLRVSATELGTELGGVQAEHSETQAELAASLAVLNSSDARFNAIAERLAQLGQSVRSATAEADRLDIARVAAEHARDVDLAGLVDLEERLRLAESEPADSEPSSVQRDGLTAVVAACRQAEMDARLRLRTLQERAHGVTGRADQLLAAADAERAARAARVADRVRRTRGLAVAKAVEHTTQRAIALLAQAVLRAAQQRDQQQEDRHSVSAKLSGARARARELGAELATLTDAVHRDEVARAEQRLRIEQLEARAGDEYGLTTEALVGEYGPQQPVPASHAERAEYEQVRERGESVIEPADGPFDRPTLEKRAARAERDLALLGKINPLALEEFAALEERHQFLATQLEDLKNTRRDLLTVVKEVDDKILAVFEAAFADVAAEFELVFESLFPGGEGRLVLTDPADMLLTGIEIEARPPGKKVKRLSLLSGGERSLTAVALLVAIFRARPSPFYVMDEIEAALDDVNLSRLVGLIGQLRSSSQIIIITHQKRTMEVADALYGVTMRGDGISQVISQRLRETAV